MKKIIVLVIALFPVWSIGQTVTENYTKSTTYLIATQSETVADAQKIESVTYYDGLGRPIQSVALQAGGQKQNIVQHMEYDDLGRTTKSYLPYATPGEVVTNPLSYIDATTLTNDIHSFYDTSKYEYTQNPYSEIIYDGSPENRPVKQGAPGNSWAIAPSSGEEHVIHMEYLTNDGHSVAGRNDYVMEFRVHLTGGGYTPELVMDGYYKTGDLVKSITKDENWVYATRWFEIPGSAPVAGFTKEIQDHTTEEYTNKEGQVVLKRTFNDDTPHDTYYVYDDYGNLSYVLPPELSAQIAALHPNPQSVDAYINSWPFTDVASPYANTGHTTPHEGNLEVSILGETMTVDFPVHSNPDNRFFLHEETIKPLNTPFTIDDIVLGEITGKIYAGYLGGPSERVIGEVRVENGNLVVERTEALLGSFHEFAVAISTTITTSTTGTTPEFNAVTFDNTFLDQLGYQYVYDYRNRLVEKKVPGKGWEYILYDKLDRPVLTQDARLRENNQWLFTKYDALNRVAYTGMYMTTSSRSILQQSLAFATVLNENMTSSIGSIDGEAAQYTNNAFPTTGLTLHTLNYYDDYVDHAGLTLPTQVYGQAVTTEIQGLATVSRVRVLDTDDWITSLTAYDAKGRPIYSGSINDYLDTEDISENLLDFTGNSIQTRTTHSKGTQEPVVTTDYFTYDHQQRLENHTQQINVEAVQLIASNGYDELGQLRVKHVGGQLFQSGYTDITPNYIDVSDDGVITKIAGGSGYNAGLSTIGRLDGDGGLSFVNTSSNKRYTVGFNDNSSSSSYAEIDYAFLFNWQNPGRYRVIVRENGGSSYITSYLTYEVGDHFTIERLDNDLSFVHNGITVATHAMTQNFPSLVGDISMRDEGAQISDLTLYATTIDASLQTVNYQYNVRGWLTDINSVDTQDRANTDLFNFRIHYDGNFTGSGITPGGSVTPLYNGNISQTVWKTANADDDQWRSYGYAYDALNRINAGFSRKGTQLDVVDSYSLWDVAYDKNGNIQHLKRNGKHETSNSPDLMDNLNYTYTGNQLQDVRDAANSSIDNEGFYDGNTSGVDYTYDVNGNMIEDKNKGITSIAYNHLNLPTQVDINILSDAHGDTQRGVIYYVYDATGVKLEKRVENQNENTTVHTYYANGYLYEDKDTIEKLLMFPHPEGYIEPVYNTDKSVKQSLSGSVGTTNSGYQYAFQYKDHLGNVRLTYADSDLDGSIKPSNEIISEKHYYPFGLQQRGYNDVVTSNSNSMAERFMYNGKENNPELGLEWYDFGARNYEASLGRWMNIDPLAELMRRHSPYNYAFDNPLRFTDPDGMAPEDVIIKGDLADKAFEELQSSVAGQLDLSKDADGNVSFEIAEGGAPLTEGAQQLVDAISDHSVVVNVNATDTGESEAIGVFQGNKTDENGIVQTKQLVDPNKTSIIDNTSNDPGATVLHEVVESHIGGTEALARGVTEVRPATKEDRLNEGSIFNKAHTEAPQPRGKIIRDSPNRILFTRAPRTELEKKHNVNKKGRRVNITKY